MLRIHVSGWDLSKVRMATGPDALWETILSFHRLRDRRASTVFGKWRSETRPRLNGEVRLLSAVVPPRGYFPDFLTPYQLGAEPMDFATGMEALRDTPPERLRAELAVLGAQGSAGGRTATARAVTLDALGEGRAEPLGRLIGVLRAYHRAAVEPYWPHVQASVEADRAVRGRALLDGGAEELLASLPPVIRWRAPVLEADYPVDRELHLDGRGLLLQPSFFCRGAPVVYRDPLLPPVLVYPVTHAAAPVFAEPGPWLGRLLGNTRSTVLRVIGDGCTTSELARRAGVSLASASQHACVLREAGLVHTLRHGSSVLHTLTPLGGSLLRGGAPKLAMS
ncbi:MULTISPECIES: helix-turn-helix transcriptional regulator [unclassified Streptomyces]|uniref:ArsR/SmtB family transcription factor n=1 Tax=unclassified Streptomyces TaxID=2593676 RepID=UPI0022598B25|nr:MULTISPECIES: helix-turn-helix domain-containing protein [unclassified Streptomyces]MCX5140135.1 helix-turn-helix domain-containing protein [Streptomyces sp. NBC_00338]WRZ64730.1 helix-turn-helix domain-containing protein [Streptomyces sp. NBC_01257]WSU58710.1 helix-turn-helix domain-containing protein [Streptomyces sp. NBC_01104]